MEDEFLQIQNGPLLPYQPSAIIISEANDDPQLQLQGMRKIRKIQSTNIKLSTTNDAR